MKNLFEIQLAGPVPPASVEWGEETDSNGVRRIVLKFPSYFSPKEMHEHLDKIVAPRKGNRPAKDAYDCLPSDPESLRLREINLRNKIILRSRTIKRSLSKRSFERDRWIKKAVTGLRRSRPNLEMQEISVPPSFFTEIRNRE